MNLYVSSHSHIELQLVGFLANMVINIESDVLQFALLVVAVLM